MHKGLSAGYTVLLVQRRHIKLHRVDIVGTQPVQRSTAEHVRVGRRGDISISEEIPRIVYFLRTIRGEGRGDVSQHFGCPLAGAGENYTGPDSVLRGGDGCWGEEEGGDEGGEEHGHLGVGTMELREYMYNSDGVTPHAIRVQRRNAGRS